MTRERDLAACRRNTGCHARPMAELLLELGNSDRLHRERLNRLLEDSTGPIRVATAYLTDRRLLRGSNVERRLLVPIRPMDVVAGATSLECLRALIEHGVHCRTLPDHPRFHAKTYIFGTAHAVITSANLTGSALNSSLEAGVILDGGDVRSLIAWFDDMWATSSPVTINDLARMAEATDSLREEYEELRRKSESVIPGVATSGEGNSLPGPIDELFRNAERFFICNTNRRYTQLTETGGYVTEEAMHSHGFAAAWESFNYNSHMQEVAVGDAILMFAKNVGIVAVGVATGQCETLPAGEPTRIFDGHSTPEWRVPADWLVWVDDHAALGYQSSNYTFANISGARYGDLRHDAWGHFTSLGNA